VAGSLMLQVLWSVIYIACVLLLRRAARQFLPIVRREQWLLILITLALVSATWSVDPALTVRRSIAITGTCVLGIYLALRYTIRQQIALLSWMLMFSMLSSLAFCVFLPDYGIGRGSFAGDW